MKFVVGHKNPDTDSIASAIVLAYFLDCYPAKLGKLNPETEFVLRKFGVMEPETIESAKNKELILVDHSEKSQSLDDLEEGKLLAIVDHHKVGLTTVEPILYYAKPVGATSTVIAELYFKKALDLIGGKNKELTPAYAGLLLSAIISDTVLFKSPTTTELDKEMAKKLAEIAGIKNIEEFGLEILKAKSIVGKLKPEEIVEMDYKVYDFNGKKVMVGQVEVIDVKEVEDKKEEIKRLLKEKLEKEGYDLILFMITDIMREGSEILVIGNKEMFEKAFNVKLEGDSIFLEGVMSRKKQIIPPLERVYKWFLMDFSNFIPKHMEKRGKIVLEENLSILNKILKQRSIPDEGIKEELIELLLYNLSLMDTDKDPKAIRIGEREARVYTKLQERSVFYFNHGVGRSGNLIDPQPKAPGASIMYKLTNQLLESFLKKLGLKVNAIATPVATGMSIALCLSALRRIYRVEEIVYPFAGHKSPIKAISLVGLRMRLVETKLYGDVVKAPVEDIERAIKKGNSAVLSTLTFFPPREEDVVEIAKICEEYNVPHIINAAYAIQNNYYIDKLKKALKYRVDAIVSSTDKNLFTPIGGGIIYTKDQKFLREISLSYPGRASANPIANTLISLLAIGFKKYRQLMKEQKESKKLLEELLEELAKKINERVLDVKNPIASAITTKKDPVDVAGKLYNLRVTGPRGVRRGDKFETSYLEVYPYNYIVVNASIGVRKEDIYKVVERLESVLV